MGNRSIPGRYVYVDRSSRSLWERYYTTEEVEFALRLNRLDVLGLPIIVAWFFALSHAVVQRGSAMAGELHATSSVVVCQGVLAVLSLVVNFNQSQALPPKKTEDAYHALQYMGRWLLLTRHGSSLQAVYLITSFAASLTGEVQLNQLCDAVSLFTGSLASIVTVQYFFLVHFHEDTKRRALTWSQRDPPYPLRKILAANHAFQLPIAVCDIAFTKRRPSFQRNCSLLASIGLIVFYGAFYIGLIVLNRHASGHWPSPVLKKFNTCSKWVKFAMAQVMLQITLALGLWAIS